MKDTIIAIIILLTCAFIAFSYGFKSGKEAAIESYIGDGYKCQSMDGLVVCLRK